ncbi:MAG: DUF192 domain-containing protein [Alphaproteobacteria bacterium]|nr:MAG: DUF192 domain-containing protein [Alphaproteobacteria bacterium]
MLLLFFVAPFGMGMSEPIDQSVLFIRTEGKTIEFSVETATTDDQRSTGLMYRREMADDHGMIFLFKPERQVNFTMHNTYISLDMIFIRSDGTIESVLENTEPLEWGPYPSKGKVRAVLEINGGLAKKLGIKVGDRVEHLFFGNIGK